MTLDLDAIKAKREAVLLGGADPHLLLVDDLPALVAEVERMRGRLQCGTAFLHLRGIIVKVADGWGASVDHGPMVTHATLDAAFAALERAREGGGE